MMNYLIIYFQEKNKTMKKEIYNTLGLVVAFYISYLIITYLIINI